MLHFEILWGYLCDSSEHVRLLNFTFNDSHNLIFTFWENYILISDQKVRQ